MNRRPARPVRPFGTPGRGFPPEWGGFMRRYMVGLAAILALGLVATACSSKKTNDNAGGGTPTPSVTPTSLGDASTFLLTAADQSSNGTTLTITQAVFTGQNGFVAIHS